MPVSDELVAEVNEALAALPEPKTEEVKTDVAKTSEDKNVGGAAVTDSGESVVDPAKIIAASSEAETDGIGDKANVAKSSLPEIQKSVVSDYALTQAVQSGFTVEEAREFGNDKLLMRAVEKIKRADALVEQIRRERQQPQQEIVEDDPFAAIPDFKPDEFDSPEVAKAFNALKGIAQKQHEQLKELKTTTTQSVTAQRAAQQDAAVRDATAWFDNKINSLGKDFEEALGTGTYDKLVKEAVGNPVLANKLNKRNEVANQVAVLLSGYQASGIQTPPRDEVFATAAKMVLSEEFQKVKDAKIADGLAKRETQHINRAGGQKLKPNQDPLDEVAAMADQFIKDRR
jgi:hypothetical protein